MSDDLRRMAGQAKIIGDQVPVIQILRSASGVQIKWAPGLSASDAAAGLRDAAAYLEREILVERIVKALARAASLEPPHDHGPGGDGANKEHP